MGKTYTFEEALARLEAVVKELENGKLPLDKALELFGEGISLAQFCHQQLEQAEQKISLLMADARGNLTLKEIALPDLKA
ncbi:MAG: exodeoxyribonuclease VII small subunit [Bacillota bacterium]